MRDFWVQVYRTGSNCTMVLSGFKAKVAVWTAKVVVLVHDVVTLPYYFFIDKPWIKWSHDRIVWAKLEDEKDPYSCYVRQNIYDEGEDKDVATIDKIFERATEAFGYNDCYGIRHVIREEEEVTKSGKVLKKLSLGDYSWITYRQANYRIDVISKGLISLGVQSKTRIVIFAETRVEWILTAQACFRINAPVVTVYSTLGEDGIVHCIHETEVRYIVTSSEQLPKLKNIIHRLPLVTHIICMEGLHEVSRDGIPQNIQFILFSQLEECGENCTAVSYTPPVPDDLAIIMYTSGSTGVPKGVMMTHRNVLCSMKGVDGILAKLKRDKCDTYVAYLPQAHVLELAAEIYLASLGVKVGFSSPQTLTDYSTAICKKEKGDLTVLKPTFMTAVPLMLDRIRNSIIQLAGKEGTFTRLMFDFAVQYKKFWLDLGFQTPRLNRYLLKTYQDFVGGNLRVLFCGSAPLSSDTHSFIRCCLNCQVMQGYGMTETAACATIMDYHDYSVGRVGAPLATCKLRLVDWKEGKYFVTDKPNPRGEIVISGDCLTLGYFNNEEQTNESYKTEDGTRWFYTGDIGEVFPNGTLKIIDRKKDLVKLRFGEYVALGKVESEMKTNPLVENICLFGRLHEAYLVALVLPNEYELKNLAKEVNKGHMSYKEMCNDEELNKIAMEKLKEHAKTYGLVGSEIPQKIKLISDEWNPDSGLVTAALKLRRKFIENHYKHLIDEMYGKAFQNGPSSR